MKFLKNLVLVQSLLFLQLFSLQSSFAESFFVTTEQLKILESNMKNQWNTLNLQTIELTNLKNLLQESKVECQNLTIQLNDSKMQIEELKNHLKKANESLKKSKNRELKNKLLFGAGCFVVGASLGFGTYAFLLR